MNAGAMLLDVAASGSGTIGSALTAQAAVKSNTEIAAVGASRWPTAPSIPWSSNPSDFAAAACVATGW